MKQLLEFIVRSIVDVPEEVVVSQETSGDLVKLTVTLPEEQAGLVIGRQGRIIKAIRTLLSLKSSSTPFLIEVGKKEKARG